MDYHSHGPATPGRYEPAPQEDIVGEAFTSGLDAFRAGESLEDAVACCRRSGMPFGPLEEEAFRDGFDLGRQQAEESARRATHEAIDEMNANHAVRVSDVFPVPAVDLPF